MLSFIRATLAMVSLHPMQQWLRHAVSLLPCMELHVGIGHTWFLFFSVGSGRIKHRSLCLKSKNLTTKAIITPVLHPSFEEFCHWGIDSQSQEEK